MPAGKPSAADARRRAQLARIHIGAKQLCLDRETYVALIRRVSGELGREVDSSANLDADGRRAVIREMVRLGFRADERAAAKRVWAGRPRDCDQVPMLRKVEALLADAGREWAYAHGLARKMFGSARLEWLRPDQLHRLVAALQIDATRRRARDEAGHV